MTLVCSEIGSTVPVALSIAMRFEYSGFAYSVPPAQTFDPATAIVSTNCDWVLGVRFASKLVGRPVVASIAAMKLRVTVSAPVPTRLKSPPT